VIDVKSLFQIDRANGALTILQYVQHIALSLAGKASTIF
jgi:hypothetical protein